MSTYWNVHCLDCVETHDFNDANNQDALMAALCKHATAIAALAPLLADRDGCQVELHTYYGNVSTAWFAEHAGHRLVPRDEYGGFQKECGEYFPCGECKTHRRCHLPKDHTGDHAEKRP